MINQMINIGNIIIVDSIQGFLYFIAIFIIMFPCLAYMVFVYYFNKYYTRKYKNDFFYLFWGYIDDEDKLSSDKYLSLFIYYFIGAYNVNSYKFFNKRYRYFPENIKDIPPRSLMPNATKGNLENFEKKHIRWIRFNIVSKNILYTMMIIVIVLFFLAEYLIK